MLYNPLHYYDDLKVNLYNNKYCYFWQQLYILFWRNRRYNKAWLQLVDRNLINCLVPSRPRSLGDIWVNREFTQRRRRRQQERQKSNRFRQANQQVCTCIMLFCTFLCRRCTTTTWNCLISRFVEDGNKRQQLSFSFPELGCSPLEFNSKKICHHLTN